MLYEGHIVLALFFTTFQIPLYKAFIISLLAQTKTLNLKICNFQQQPNGVILIIIIVIK